MQPCSVLKISLVLSALFVAGEAQAISHYDASASTCSAIQAAVQAEGEAILHWTQAPNIQRYVRAVSGVASCAAGEEATPASVPASDGACSVLVCTKKPSSGQPDVDTPEDNHPS